MDLAGNVVGARRTIEARTIDLFILDILFDREDILAVSRLRRHAGGNDRSVDNPIEPPRRKTGVDPGKPVHVETVWGRG